MSYKNKRRKHHRSSYTHSRHNFNARRHGGWGFNLYRNTRRGKIAGVAAGMADHLDVAAWVVRLLWVVGFLFTGTLAFWLYLAAWIFIAPRPHRAVQKGETVEEADFEEVELDMEYDERRKHYRPRKVFRYSDNSTVRLQRARERLDAALRRVEDVETYITSRQYTLNKEFSKL